MAPVEHQLHEEFHKDDDLFEASGDSNADRADSGSVKPDPPTSTLLSITSIYHPGPSHTGGSNTASNASHQRCRYSPDANFPTAPRGRCRHYRGPAPEQAGALAPCAQRMRAGVQGSPAAAPASSASSSSSSPPQQQQLTLLVMQPGGGEEAAAGAAGVVLQPSADPQLPPSASGGLMVFYELGAPGEIEVGEEEVEVEAAGGESAASLEELEEEEAAAAPGAAGGEAAAGGECKSCTYEGCSETTTQVVKQRKPWMCKRHRNKIYKDKYKRKKSDQALGGGGAAAAGGGPRAEDSAEGSVSVTKQRTGSIGDRPARPTLLEQVLNKKRLSLLRSPEVVQFLQKQQQLLSQQALEQRQQQFQGAPG
ncbi:regulatory factor X-associated protein [Melozone crissalis]|uniref:regulatory factor X-associated protein n=1 Tax=Melozone crissalis TaxID=40204 RepID=UPI0023DA60A4|nr:regulatory factor X-associated protein [Melozone crissalis]